MKYLRLHISFNKKPNSIVNLSSALIRIGEADPMNVNRVTLKRKRHQNEALSRNNYFMRGILNVRKYLNGTLGKNGKYSNTMIASISKIRIRSNNDYFIRIPHGEYIRIVDAIYSLLHSIDCPYCNYLLNIELNDDYVPKDPKLKLEYKTISPVQTHIILISTCKEINHREHRVLKEELRR